MPCPKRKHTQMRRDMRRANWKIILPSAGKCPQCGAVKLSHMICPACGFYNGELVMPRKEKTKPEEAK
jgi:large subunit ribosomal protein L32